MRPVVALVGRPNVGKSTLYNRLVGGRQAIVEAEPGVTRDRRYGVTDWNGSYFDLVDTGGILLESTDWIPVMIRDQAEKALTEAGVLVLVVDGQVGLTAEDEEVATWIRRFKKPIVVAVNKSEGKDTFFYDFYTLGFGDPIAVSAIHGKGTGDLLDEVVEHLPEKVSDSDENEAVHVAIVGKPNAGKSTLVNEILGEERMIVSDVAGTTRDAIDSRFYHDDELYVLIDTAGLRKRSRIHQGVERHSALRSIQAVERADVVLLVIDALEGVSEQDQKIAGLMNEKGKAGIILLNKWDALPKDDKTLDQMTEEVREKLHFISWAPILTLSAKTGQRLHKLWPMVKIAAARHATRLSTRIVNEVIQDAVAQTPPPTDKGKRLKVFYATQAGRKPPLFVLFVNDTELVHFSYQRYLENSLRKAFHLDYTPIQLRFRQRE